MKLITPALVVAATMAAYAPIANAGSAALVLNRTTLTNVNDAAGLWQHEGGNVFKSGVKIGQYALQRRVTTGGTTAPLNTAATTITLFLATAAGSAPQNIVLQGAHDFGPGNFRGAVSAASNRFSWIYGADATYTSPAAGTISLVMSWTGASQLTLP